MFWLWRELEDRQLADWSAVSSSKIKKLIEV
jgi:hypothetical protein